jgi:hypothetical protein
MLMMDAVPREKLAVALPAGARNAASFEKVCP